VESVKAVEEMYAPITGEVVQRNEAVLGNPEELQNDPHGEGWLLVIRPSEPSQMEELMDSATYSAKVAAAKPKLDQAVNAAGTSLQSRSSQPAF
jgi:glycine cleavage system H protein